MMHIKLILVSDVPESKTKGRITKTEAAIGQMANFRMLRLPISHQPGGPEDENQDQQQVGNDRCNLCYGHAP
ncbi:MAG: hypothetical protein EBW54_10585 [Betaproteobacteria bacterium]|nr:hypothetical protein [Betaproteobacteria bacterium]